MTDTFIAIYGDWSELLGPLRFGRLVTHCAAARERGF